MGNQVEDSGANETQTMTALPGVATVRAGPSQGSTDTRPSLQMILIQKDQNKKCQTHKMELVPRGANMDTQNLSPEIKRGNEYVSQTQRQWHCGNPGNTCWPKRGVNINTH